MSTDMHGEITGLQGEIQTLIAEIQNLDRQQANKVDSQVDYEKCNPASRASYQQGGNSDMQALDTLKSEMDTLLEHYLKYTKVPEDLRGKIAPKLEEASTMAAAIMEDIERHYPEWESDSSDAFGKVKFRQVTAVKELADVSKSSGDLVKNVGDVQQAILVGVKATLSNCRNQLQAAKSKGGAEGWDTAYLFARCQNAIKPLEDANSWLSSERDGRSWSSTANELSSQMNQIDTAPNVLVGRGGWPVKTDGSAAHAAEISAESATARMEDNTETCYFKQGTFVSYIRK